MTAYAYTELHSDYPAFVNLSEKVPGVATLTVRSRGNGGRDVGVIELNRDQLRELAEAIQSIEQKK